MKNAYPKLGLARLCRLFGVTRQAYYQYCWHMSDIGTEAHIVLNLVNAIRKDQPKLGTRKLLSIIQNDLIEHQIKMGRDALFDLLASHNMLVRRRKRTPQTTFSKHWYRKYDNLLKDFICSGPHQLWVSDITYISTGDDYVYLALISDGYSRKIVGYNLSENLSTEGCIMALNMAFLQLPAEYNLIHHSDRGIQYCSMAYTNLLSNKSIRISMTQNGDPYENAMAERLNGILKQELLKKKYQSYQEAKNEIDIAVKIYNEKRPHLSCDLLTPERAHVEDGILKRHWRNKEVMTE
ncbi:IS3 family transposase [Sporocytophaga myxococcoides]|uniref:IS3 family transposase n=1 Tax=Sporocytophaga myxococcoides TaxID=153721 RepID=UPI0004048775|nr:IS3 family transposase [Sporocytophaga myxococcoides]